MNWSSAAVSSASTRASVALRIAYFFPAYWVVQQALHWEHFAKPRVAALLWPVQWMAHFEVSTVGPWLLFACCTGLLVAAVIPEHGWARWVGAFALLEYLALRFSFGKIHHLMHGWLLVIWVACWLPRGWTKPAEFTLAQHRRLLTVFHTCQLLLATTYTLSGVGKVLGVGYQFWLGQSTLLHPSSLARHTAARLLETSDVSLIGPWVIQYGHYLWPATLMLTALQLGAVWLARRPRFHPTLGTGLILFHALTTLTMNIDFTPAIVLCGILFVASPFTPVRATPARGKHPCARRAGEA